MLSEILTYFQTNSPQYGGYLITHLLISGKALFFAALIGLPLGFLSYRIKPLAELFQTMSQLLRIIPSLAVLFLLIPLIGVGELPALIALTFLAIPSILINTALGFHEVSKITKEVASGLGMNHRQLFCKIEIPLALPFILNGLKLALVEILASATLATYIGAGGLGTLIFTGLGLYRMDLLLIGGGSVTLLSLLCIALFDLMIRKVKKNYV
ncbi:ABC transporter permease [Enterococcus sp. HY326]|uniref:ABC transporter permease n=1 Tax=Enterococcus sp. HY326 TaxID=2971265 RepID=UPI002240A61D|nr:ABC transporter permease [Enterococcus sp. HY326]